MNILSTRSQPSGCGACSDKVQLFPFTMAFQPIVDTVEHSVYAYEALVRGNNGESAHSVLRQLTEHNRYAFDQQCRVKAITLAAELGVHHQGARLSLNFMPDAVYSPAACIQRTLHTARQTGFPLDLLTFEVTEDQRVRDVGHLERIIAAYQSHGFHIALDDFGAGFSGLALLSDLNVDAVKLDMQLIRGLDRRPRAGEIVRSITGLCHRLGGEVIAEGVETASEYRLLRDAGIRYMQGYLFARPLLETLPRVFWPDDLVEPLIDGRVHRTSRVNFTAAAAAGPSQRAAR